MRSYVMAPMRHGRLFLGRRRRPHGAPDRGQGAQPGGGRRGRMAPALTALLRENDTRLADAYSDMALRRVWRCTHFSWWMTTMSPERRPV